MLYSDKASISPSLVNTSGLSGLSCQELNCNRLRVASKIIQFGELALV